jgi:hypothetical protein
VVLGAAAAASLTAQVRLHAVRHDALAHRAVVPVVHAELLLLAAVVTAFRPSWLCFLLALEGAFAVMVARRPAEAQV